MELFYNEVILEPREQADLSAPQPCVPALQLEDLWLDASARTARALQGYDNVNPTVALVFDCLSSIAGLPHQFGVYRQLRL